MRNIKRFAALLLVFAVNLSLSACTSEAVSSDSEGTAYTEQTVQTSQETLNQTETRQTTSAATEAESTTAVSEAAVVETVTVHVHSYIEEILPPTCVRGALKKYTCTGCGDTYTEDYSDGTADTEPLGHSYTTNVIVTEATKYSPGTRRFTCDRCGENYDAAYGYAHKVSAYDGTHIVYGYWDVACENEIYRLLNEYRKSVNADTLSRGSAIQDTARERALEIAYSYRHDHSRPTNAEWLTAYPNQDLAGENIASGQADAQEVTTGWIESSRHEENMSNVNYTSVGIGVFVRVDCEESGEVNTPDPKGLSHEDDRYYVQSFQ